MLTKTYLCFIILLLVRITAIAQKTDAYKPDFSKPKQIAGMFLVWNDEFNITGKPDAAYWKYEKGFVRNQELQWYQSDNANCKDGVLLIEGRKEELKNPNYKAGNTDWRTSREYASHTASSITTQGLKQWQFGRFEIRARIDTVKGSWPAIWTLGVTNPWPSNGEIDIMEFYRVKEVPTILANVAWGTSQRYVAKWDTERIPLSNFTTKDANWVKKFHIWRMDWDKNAINLYLDDVLLNSTPLSEMINADNTNPFLQPQYLLLNLAIGGNGGTPATTTSIIRYEVDYVRVYQKE